MKCNGLGRGHKKTLPIRDHEFHWHPNSQDEIKFPAPEQSRFSGRYWPVTAGPLQLGPIPRGVRGKGP
jgi:hypothetical protein